MSNAVFVMIPCLKNKILLTVSWAVAEIFTLIAWKDGSGIKFKIIRIFHVLYVEHF
jgi:hypothetical protein